MAAKKENMYERVTNAMIAAIEKGAGQWQMPWHRDPAGSTSIIPYNATTKVAYRGMNIMLLWSTGLGTQWATYKQWEGAGAQVRKGERGTLCVKWSRMEMRPKDGEPVPAKPRSIMVPFGFTVFAASQVDGYEPEPTVPAEPKEDKTKKLRKVDALIKRHKVKLAHRGDRAYYLPMVDEVVMPPRNLFKGSATSDATESYYGTMLHEMVHWTGHESRCKREFGKRFGDDAYAFEELVAEMGSAFACAHLGVSNEPRIDHAQYLANWLRVLRGDNKAIFTAASKAQEACDFLMPQVKPVAKQEAA